MFFISSFLSTQVQDAFEELGEVVAEAALDGEEDDDFVDADEEEEEEWEEEEMHTHEGVEL